LLFWWSEKAIYFAFVGDLKSGAMFFFIPRRKTSEPGRQALMSVPN
jgi:hypothetical protein